MLLEWEEIIWSEMLKIIKSLICLEVKSAILGLFPAFKLISRILNSHTSKIVIKIINHLLTYKNA